MLLKVNCWTNWITVTKCYCWRGPWRHLRLNPISGKHTLSQILGSWQTSNSSHHAAHKAQPQPVPINARWHERWNLLASSTWFPYCTGEEHCPITRSSQKQGKDQTSLFHALSTTPACINGKTSISLLHTFGPFFPSSPSKHSRLTLVVDMIQIPYSPVSSEQQYFCFSILGFPPRSIKLRSNAFE